MVILLRTLPAALAASLVLLGVPAAAIQPTGNVAPQESAAPIRYARVAKSGAQILNLADEKGMQVATPARGEILAVYEEHSQGWLGVELPGGYAVWVFGRYLEPTSEEGVHRVTRNAVNIRPGPSSDVRHFPLAQRLHAGDRVRVLEILDPTAPLSETWARILSPPGVRAWIRAEAVTPLAATESGPELWLTALAGLQSDSRPMPRTDVAAPKEKPAPKAVNPEELARKDLVAAQALLQVESQSDAPNFPAVRTAVEAVLRKVPTGAVAMEAKSTLERISTLEEAAQLKAELLLERERRSQLALNEQKAVWEASKKKDPFGGVFLMRGVLTRTGDVEGTPRYFLKFDRETVCELFCSTGRYDLERYSGFYVGVQGAELRTSEPSDIPPVEISRLEVLAKR